MDDGYMDGWMGEVNGWMDRQMDGRIGKQNEQTGEQVGGLVGGWMNGQIDGWTGKQNGNTGEQVGGWMRVWLEVGCMNGVCLVSSHLQTFALGVLSAWITLQDIPLAQLSHFI